ncbi:DUF445 domain-containing protein [Desulfosporosinus sp. PR]|uniref:DUF445 domain-containing protein n=1 Tax=Candidatus Desulfosporosinus nitrosoreducens TaxID=3401928 RepID=UPI0027F71615|nr:DUF445 domain-containing protein [Desulfosporosinus sp. PR]MDQ7095593.1 DUF445 domain-containing protein [Desulfosporosinus sp. PR]
MVKKINNTRSANFTLGGITLGFLLSYPFHASFVGGLISSGCSAGMIGGLADWFAVTALFRRPLGIRPSKVLRTEIIPLNRERIFNALADMVQNELLSQEILERKLLAWDFSGVLIRVLQQDQVKQAAEQVLTDLAGDFAQALDPQGVTQSLQDLMQRNINDLELAQTLADVIEFSLKSGQADHLLKTLCRAGDELIAHPVVSKALTAMIEAALLRYGSNNPTRKLVGKFLPAPEVLAQGLITRAKSALRDGTVEQWLKEFILRFISDLRTEPELRESVNRLCHKALAAKLGGTAVTENSASLLKAGAVKLRNDWDQHFEAFKNNPDLRQTVDKTIRNISRKQIEYHHDAIGRLVREGLNPLSNDKLVKLIEDKAGNDLQMIRINGTIVGGLVGMLIYVLGMVLQ